MTKFPTTTLFRPAIPRADAPMDKTTRAARDILDDEVEMRLAKTGRRRKAGLERESVTPAKAPKGSASASRNKIACQGG